MTHWYALLAAAGLTALGAEGYLAQLDDERLLRGAGIGRYRDGRGRSGREGPEACVANQPFFSFAPVGETCIADGTGLGAVCACANVTGTRGEAITYVGDPIMCTKGNETSGIANGDLVLCPANKPAIMPGGDGTGGLGLLRWEARTNRMLRSQELDNVAVTLTASGVANPTVTANLGIAPDGTMTAERIWFPATTSVGSQYSIAYESAPALAANVIAHSIYVRGCISSSDGGCLGLFADGGADVLSEAGDGGVVFSDGGPAVGVDGGNGTGAIYLALTAGTPAYTACPYVATSWSRCLNPVTNSGANGTPNLGNRSDLTGTNLPISDAFMWGWQYEVATTAALIASPYIVTQGTSVTRAGNSATTAALVFPVATASTAATLVGPGGTSGDEIILDANNYAGVDSIGGPTRCSWRSAGGITNATAGTPVTTAPYRIACSSTPSFLTAYLNGVAGTPVVPTAALSATFTFGMTLGGHSASSFVANGVVKNVCWDSTSTRCR